MGKAEELAEKARAVAARKARQQSGQVDSASEVLAVVATPHVKPVRSTVDLAPVRHAALKSWCGETAVMIGESRVTTQDVFRVLVTRLLTDETLARKIRDDLRQEKAK